MCGIAGVFGGKCDFHSAGNAYSLVEEMTRELAHRGPDDEGIQCLADDRLCFGHRRLAIQDISAAGAQPMPSSCGNFVIAYNGEIYNHLELRKKIEQHTNIAWNGSSDTETLIEAISQWGLDTTLKSTVGMFAFALWDKKERQLILARDRFGEKPLYYTQQGNLFLFASELKAIECYPEFNKEIDSAAVQQFLTHKFIPAPLSIWKHVHKLRPASYVTIDTKTLRPTEHIYWDSKDIFLQNSLNPTDQSIEEIEKNVQQLLSRSVEQQMISDVPLGSFLSGGIDSSLVTMLMQNQSTEKINTFSIGIGDSQFNESAAASAIAKQLGTNHTEFQVQPDDVLAVMPEMNTMYDEPFSDSSQLVTYLVSKLAREHVTVALTGDGGDEFFCGYNRYTFSYNHGKKLLGLPSPIKKAASHVLQKVPTSWWTRAINTIDGKDQKVTNQVRLPEKLLKIARSLEEKDRHGLYRSFLTDTNPDDFPYSKNDLKPFNFGNICDNKDVPLTDYLMYADSQFYLPGDILTKTDRASMATSLETRTPFLDHRLVEYAWSIPTDKKLADGKSKSILRNILYKQFDRSTIDRPKMGFSVPISQWLNGPLKPIADKYFDAINISKSGFLDPHTTTRLWLEHKSGKTDHHAILWSILSFQIWYESRFA